MAIRVLGRGMLFAVLALLMVGNIYVGARKHSRELEERNDRDEAYENIRLFTEVLEQVREKYVDGDKVGYDQLVESALKGMLPALDEHSQFLDANMHEDMMEDTSGRFGGIGVVISMKNNMLTIVAPMEDTPGFRAGLLSGDRIIKIGDMVTKGLSLEEAVSALRGELGTPVEMTVYRPASNETLEFSLVREVIKVSSIKDVSMLDEEVGYLRIIQFSKPTSDALQEALNELFEQGMKSLVIDLRNNPGGLLGEAIEVSEKFLPRDALVVYTQGRHREDRRTYEARGNIRYLDLPIVILVNDGSASAAEIVAGALQDHGRAVLVGERTFGKASVQSILELDNGAALRLTTARYYTPSERPIHHHGIEPNIVVPVEAETWRKIQLKRSLPAGYVPGPDEEDLSGVEDPQLQRAVELLHGLRTFQAQRGDPEPARMLVAERP